MRLIGAGQATRLLLSGQTFDAAEALSLRVVEQVVPAEQLPVVAAKWIDRLAAVPASALQGYVAMIRQTGLGADVAALRAIQSDVHSDSYLEQRLSMIKRR